MNYQKEFNAKKQHMWARFLFPPGQAYFMPSFSINAFYNHDPTWVINHNLGNKEPAIKTAKDKEWKRAQKNGSQLQKKVVSSKGKTLIYQKGR